MVVLDLVAVALDIYLWVCIYTFSADKPPTDLRSEYPYFSTIKWILGLTVALRYVSFPSSLLLQYKLTILFHYAVSFRFLWLQPRGSWGVTIASHVRSIQLVPNMRLSWKRSSSVTRSSHLIQAHSDMVHQEPTSDGQDKEGFTVWGVSFCNVKD